MTTADEKFTARKNKKKRIRTAGQILFLLAVAAFCTNALFTLTPYISYTGQPVKFSGDKGFIALAYFGVERTGTQALIGTDRLREHLQALKKLGYVTISQQDIADYYRSGKELPEKSLFLIFEDGRRDTAIFAQKILEELNFKATMLTYAANFAKQDPKFLTPDELKNLEKTSFWELGTNGYRLAFINVFDRYGNYLGELNPLQHAKVAPYLGRKYNHYLMDYIRDEYGIPKESHTRMKDRIAYDYEALGNIYARSVGYIPGTHILMHSNTGSFGNNAAVSVVNKHWIEALFTMNFNWEGFCFNQRSSSIYDLTRMQPQAYWSANHLLMRIQYDIHQPADFIKGDLDKQNAWETLKGAAELKEETIILTSLPNDKGLLRLKNSNDFADLKLAVRLRGNKLGLQKIYLRTGEKFSRFLAVSIQDNILYITEKTGGSETELCKLNLDQHDGKTVQSVPEDKKAAEMRALEAFLQYAGSAGQAGLYSKRLQAKSLEDVPTVAQGAAAYIPDLSAHEKGDRTLSLSLAGDKISVQVDGQAAVTDLQLSNTAAGSVYLESAWSGYGWSQRNPADDVYDGVFEKLVITETTGRLAEEKILFDSGLQGWDAVKFAVKKYWQALINWFIVNF
ncbi:hypothetical protein [Acetonema longum]|uniref:Polysaccharide deacetylase n=1 Tax=Acetonema longum DSM 6540 TaxID=1009370 RepID=F7NJT0_9FIRM|nr:hypothetical protein [Acetonema longum]EGO63736.1 hypothetical protein ALO_11689 [Acetonema longum DSM 6540]